MFERAKERVTEVVKKALGLAPVRFVMRTLKKSSDDHVGAYSAQIAFYILMTVFPMVILFLQLIRVAPISQESILYAIDSVFPEYLLTTLHGLLQEVYSASTGLVPITIVTMLWTTSKVMHAMTQCLDTICSKEEARNWLVVRLWSITCTGLAFMVAKLLSASITLILLLPEILIIVVVTGAAFLFFSGYFRTILKTLHKRIQEADGNLRVAMQEQLESMLVIRAFSQEEAAQEQVRGKMALHRQARLRRSNVSNFFNVGYQVLMNGAYVLASVYCGYLIG